MQNVPNGHNSTCQMFDPLELSPNQWLIRSALLPLCLIGIFTSLCQLLLLIRRTKLIFNTVGLFLLVAAPIDVLFVISNSLWHIWRQCSTYQWHKWYQLLIRHINSIVGCQSLSLDVLTCLLLLAQLEILCTVAASRNRGCFKVFVRIPVLITAICSAAFVSWPMFFYYNVKWFIHCSTPYTRLTVQRDTRPFVNVSHKIYPMISTVAPLLLTGALILLTGLVALGCAASKCCRTQFKQGRTVRPPFKHILCVTQVVVVLHLVLSLLPRTILLNRDWWVEYIRDDDSLLPWILNIANVTLCSAMCIRPCLVIYMLNADLFIPNRLLVAHRQYYQFHVRPG